MPKYNYKDYYHLAVNNEIKKKFRIYKSAIKYIDKNEECFNEEGYMKDNIEIIWFINETMFVTKICDDDLDFLY